MFWLRNLSYLITSSSSSTLLHNMLISHSDVWQCLFYLLIACIQQTYWLIILLSNIFFRLGVEFLQILEQKKKFQYKEKKLLSFQQVRLGKVKNFSVAEKFLKWTAALNLEKQTMKRNSRFNAVMFNQYFLILWCFYCAFSNISYVKRIGFVKHIK